MKKKTPEALDRIAGRVLAYRPKPTTIKAKSERERRKKHAKTT